MGLLESVKTHVIKLNPEWLKAKRECFIAEPFYDPNKDKILATVEGTQAASDDLLDGIREIVVDKDFKGYCWDHYFQETIFSTEKNANFPIDGNDVAKSIILEIEALLSDVKEVTTISKTIIAIIEVIGDSIIELRRNYKSEEYTEVLDYFLNGFKKSIPSRYCHSKEVFDIVSTVKDRLEFDLNQDELAALLYILYRADMLHTPTPTDTSFLNFCSEFFYFRNQKRKAFTPALDVRGKFNDAKNGVTIKSLDAIVKKLQDSFESL